MDISSESASNFIAFVALIIAIWSLVSTEKFNKRQDDFSKTAEKLNKIYILKEEEERIKAEKADICLSSYKNGQNNYRIKIYNKGFGRATNVNIVILDGHDSIPEGELEAIFPIDSMDQHQMVELHLAVTQDTTSRKILAKITWDDATSVGNIKEVSQQIF